MPSITVGQTLSNSARTSQNQYDLIVSLKLNSQNVQNNTSNVTVTLQLKSNYAYFQQYACSGSLSLTGASPGSYSAQYSFPSLYSTITLKTWTGNVTHSADGTYTVTASGTISCDGTYGAGTGSVSLSGVTLPRIPRASVLGTIPAFVYDGNSGVGAAFSVPTTRYYSGFYDVLTISVGGTTIHTINGYTGGTVTLPSTAVNAAYAKMTTSNSAKFTFLLTTYSSSSKTTVIGTSTKTATGSISSTGRAPSFTTFTYADQNATTIALTGDSSSIVQGYSLLRATVSAANKATANKGASMSKYQLNIGGVITEVAYGTGAVTLSNASPQSATIGVTAIDSRGNTKTVYQTATFIKYTDTVVKSGSASRALNGAGTETSLTYAGSYSAVDFGAATNTILSAQYRYKRANASSYGDWTALALPTITDGAYSASNVAITGDLGASGFNLDYAYSLQVRVTDRLSEAVYTLQINAGKPIIALHKEGIALGKPYTTPGIVDSAWTMVMNGRNVLGYVRSLTSSDNLNNLTEQGIYIAPSNDITSVSRNYPVALAGTLEVITISSGSLMQRYSTYNNSGVYVRNYYDYRNVWYEWRKLTVDDTGWIQATLASGISAASSGYGGARGIQYRKIENHVHVRGSISFTAPGGNGSILLSALPSEYAPTYNHYVMNAVTSGYQGRTYINQSGQLRCDWVMRISDGAYLSTRISWYAVKIDYFLD